MASYRSRWRRRRQFGDYLRDKETFYGRIEMTTCEIDSENLKEGLLGLVLALVEIIRDVIKRQSFKRMEGGSLTEQECERLCKALMDLDVAIDQLKKEHALEAAVQQVRDGLDDVADQIINPERWISKETR